MKNVSQRVLMLVGGGDWLIPSEAEGKRLEKILPRCNVKARHHQALTPQTLSAHAVRGHHVLAPANPGRRTWQLQNEHGGSSAHKLLLAICQCVCIFVLNFFGRKGAGLEPADAGLPAAGVPLPQPCFAAGGWHQPG